MTEKGTSLGPFAVALPGEHNVLNALACLAQGRAMGIDLPVIRDVLKDFRGVKRRFDVLGRGQGILCVDDYGHHPTEIRSTLKAARQVAAGRVVVVFQPHRYSRTKHLFDELADSLQDCDGLIVTDIYAAGETPEPDINSPALCERVREKGKADVVYLKRDNLLEYLRANTRENDLVLTLGAGDIRQIGEQFARVLEQAGEKV